MCHKIGRCWCKAPVGYIYRILQLNDCGRKPALTDSRCECVVLAECKAPMQGSLYLEMRLINKLLLLQLFVRFSTLLLWTFSFLD